MADFKAGDRVRCINNKYAPPLTVGEVYTVLRVTHNDLLVIEEVPHAWGALSSERFEPVVEAVPLTSFKVGDKVRCVDNSLSSTLRVGDVYTVTKVATDNTLALDGVLLRWAGNRFEAADKIVEAIPFTGPKSFGDDFQKSCPPGFDDDIWAVDVNFEPEPVCPTKAPRTLGSEEEYDWDDVPVEDRGDGLIHEAIGDNTMSPFDPNGIIKEDEAGTILRDARDIVTGPRNVTHGPKERSFQAIADDWTAYITNRPDPDAPLSAVDFCHMMVRMKQVRYSYGGYMRDHFVDQAGYAAGAGEMALMEHEGGGGEP